MSTDHRPSTADVVPSSATSLNTRATQGGAGSLRENAFQWRNLYHHRYGIATYPPPVPRNPSTTTMTYPNVDAFLAMREQEANSGRKSVVSTVLDMVGSSSTRSGGSVAQRSNSIGEGSTSPVKRQSRNALFSRSSFLLQRKAQLMLKKKREMEELRKQNPHALEQCILNIHQQAWMLLVDDSIIKATSLEAKDYGDAARDMKERLMEQMKRNMLAMEETPFSLDGPELSREGLEPSRGLEEEGYGRLPQVGDHALPSGSTNPIHLSITAERDRRLNLLAEFAPFFAVISPPNVVSSMHAQAMPTYGRYTMPTPGGSGDHVGLPLFSQYHTWEESCRQREAWPRAPFHFFLARDVSFHFAHVTAAILMLETVAKFLHRHKCTNTLATNGEQQNSSNASDAKRRASQQQTGRTKGLFADALGAPQQHHGRLSTNDDGGGQQPRLSPTTPELWDGRRRHTPESKCSNQQNPSACPFLAMEQLSEDVIIVFEHAGARNALPMMVSVMRLFLDKALRPGLSAQLFGKAALLDIFETGDGEEDGVLVDNNDAEEPYARGAPFGASGSNVASKRMSVSSTNAIPPALAHLLDIPRMKRRSGADTAGGAANLIPRAGNPTVAPTAPIGPLDESSSSSSDEDEADSTAPTSSSLFSEREFHAIFSLSQWFLDSATATCPMTQRGRSAAAGGGSQRKRSQQQKSAPTGYSRIQNTAKAPTLSIADAVVRFESARKLRLKAITRRERQLREEAALKIIQQREEQERERQREQDELRRKQIAAMQSQFNAAHAHHSRGTPSGTDSHEESLSSMREHTRAPQPADDHTTTTVVQITVPPQTSPKPEDVEEDIGDFFVEVESGAANKFGPLLMSTVVPTSNSNVSCSVAMDDHSSNRLLSLPGVSHPRAHRQTLLPPSASIVASGHAPTKGGETCSPSTAAPTTETGENIPAWMASLRAAVDEEMPVAATKLATPLILLSSYMKLHGVGWCRDVCRGLLDFLSYPDIFLYVTDDDLVAPPAPPKEPQRSQSTAVKLGRSPSSEPLTERQVGSEILSGPLSTPNNAASSKRPSFFSSNAIPVVFSRAGSLAPSRGGSLTPQGDSSLEASASRLSISGVASLASQLSPRAQPPPQWRFPVEDDGAPVLTSTNSERKVSASFGTGSSTPRTVSVQLPSTSPPQHSIATPTNAQKNLPFSADGLDPAMVTFLSTMLGKETARVEHIRKALEIWFHTLEGSHASQKVPSGIAYLVTAMCTSVHSHLLSGVVMSSALDVDGVEADSLGFVEHLINTLMGNHSGGGRDASEPPQQHHDDTTSKSASEQIGAKNPGPPPSGGVVPSSRRRATVIIEPEQRPSTANAGANLPPPVVVTSQPPPPPTTSEEPSTNHPAEAAQTHGPGGAGTISLVSDVRTFRLAKFLLFDIWLLPMLSNAQRYGLIPPHATPHLINNINAFVRYVKILVNAPYTKRDEERRKSASAAKVDGTDSHPAASSSAPSPVPAEAPKHAAPAAASMSDVDAMVPTEYESALRRSLMPSVISGIYNASNGSLVQLFRFPEHIATTAASSASSDSRKKSAALLSVANKSRSIASANRTKSIARTVSVASRLFADSGSGEGSAPRSVSMRSQSAAASSAIDYYIPQQSMQQIPSLSQLSPPLQQLNAAIGVAHSSGLFPTPAATLQASSASTGRHAHHMGSTVPNQRTVTEQLEVFCWHASTDEDRHRVIAEFQVPPHVAVGCTENIYKVITGQHPATRYACGSSSPGASLGRDRSPSSAMQVSQDTTPQQHRLSVLSLSSGGTQQQNTADGTKSKHGGEGEPHKEVVDLYLRCLHSVLLHPTSAGQALDCLSLNHRKLFHQLMRIPSTIASSTKSGEAGSALDHDATSLACSVYPYLIVGVRDQPLVDLNAITMLTSGSLVTQQSVPLPSSFIQARRRLLSRQLFLATGAGIAADDLNDAAPVANPSSPTRTRRRSSHSIAISQDPNLSRSGGDTGDDGPIPQPLFAAWWCYMAAALCAKAECVLEECSAHLSKRWERRCKQTMRRYSHRDSVAEATISSSAGKNSGVGSRLRKAAGTRKIVAHIQSPTKSNTKAATEQSGLVPKPPGATGGSLLAPSSRYGGDHHDGGRRMSASSAVAVRKHGGSGGNNVLMQRWREAVTDVVDRSEEEGAAIMSNSSSARPSRAPSLVGVGDTPRLAPRAPRR